MHNVVRSIIDIDNQANERLEMAVDQKEEIIQKAKDETKAIRAKYEKEALNRIEKTMAMNDKIALERISELKKQREFEISEMDENFNKYHLEIEDSIYKRIVGE